MRLGSAIRATIALAEQFGPPKSEAADLLRPEVQARLSSLYAFDEEDPSEVEEWRAFSGRCLPERGNSDEVRSLSWLLLAPEGRAREYCEGFDLPEGCERA